MNALGIKLFLKIRRRTWLWGAAVVLVLVILTITLDGRVIYHHKPGLYVFVPEANGFRHLDEMDAAPAAEMLVITVHGWGGFDIGHKSFPAAAATHCEQEGVVFGYFDWQARSFVYHPRRAARYSREHVGPDLAEVILRRWPDVRHVHLIGHSAGSWGITEAAKILAEKSGADLHLTFLDAYCPLSWDAGDLGLTGLPAGREYWADNYLTIDPTGPVTEQILANAHNVDISEGDRFLGDHRFPFFWYKATVTGFYSNRKYKKVRLVLRGPRDIFYGWYRSREADLNAWEKSLGLGLGNTPVILKQSKVRRRVGPNYDVFGNNS